MTLIYLDSFIIDLQIIEKSVYLPTYLSTYLPTTIKYWVTLHIFKKRSRSWAMAQLVECLLSRDEPLGVNAMPSTTSTRKKKQLLSLILPLTSKQADQKFKVIPSYTARSRPAWVWLVSKTKQSRTEVGTLPTSRAWLNQWFSHIVTICP